MPNGTSTNKEEKENTSHTEKDQGYEMGTVIGQTLCAAYQ
jgi:hypothetical protein